MLLGSDEVPDPGNGSMLVGIPKRTVLHEQYTNPFISA
jgi:hypothetical protein